MQWSRCSLDTRGRPGCACCFCRLPAFLFSWKVRVLAIILRWPHSFRLAPCSKSRLQEFFLGSVTNYAVHHCKRPVLVHSA